MDCQGRSLARLDGIVAVVTGATRGIGRPVAERLAALGARVVLPVRNPAQGELVAEAIQQRNGHAEVVRADLASLASVRSAAESAATNDDAAARRLWEESVRLVEARASGPGQ